MSSFLPHPRNVELLDLIQALTSAGSAAAIAGPTCIQVSGPDRRSVSGVTHDSRAVAPGGVFVALPGRQHDGHRYVPLLCQAAAVVVQQPVAAPQGVTTIQVPDTRRALPFLVASFYDNPGKKLDVVGITGTNGKTTITWLLESILNAAGQSCGVIGTTGHRVAGHAVSAQDVLGGAAVAHHTTPEAPVIQALLASMVEAGCRAAPMEVSSIALSSWRAEAIPFRVGVFTNLTQDHLDIHGTMEVYRAAKARLFHELLAPGGHVVLNADDPSWRSMCPAGHPLWTYGLREGQILATDLVLGPDGTRAHVSTPLGEGIIQVPLPARHNVQNALAALGAALALGISLDVALEGICRAPAVPGRLERVPGPGFSVFVDYAHTDDALAQVLASLREVAPARIVTVFGCGGDRDRAKRPLMGAAAAAGSDRVFVTSDNPRSEDPRSIIAQILEGIPAETSLRVMPDRQEAIHAAIGEARPGDIVLLAGKGHETTQTIGVRVLPFDDREVARAAIAGLAGRK